MKQLEQDIRKELKTTDSIIKYNRERSDRKDERLQEQINNNLK